MEVLYLVLVVGAVFFGIYSFFSKRKEREETIDSLTGGNDVLASWDYSDSDQAEFEAITNNYRIHNIGLPDKLIISPNSIYLSNGTDEYLYDFNENSKMVTHCSYRESVSKLKFRLRWRKWNSSREIYELEKEDIVLSIPAGNPEKANRVVKYFNDKIDANMDSVNRLLPPDKLTSLFFNDEF